MYTLSSLSPLSPLLSEVSVSDSSPLFPAKQSSSDSISFCNAYFLAGAENRCGSDACSGGGGASLLHAGFCLISAFHFVGFISSSGNSWSLNYKGASSPSVFV